MSETNVTGIKSNERVKKFGEVFTPDNIVCDMLKLAEDAYAEENKNSDIDIIKRTYLEPACGNGQFLIRLLWEKLSAIDRMTKNKCLTQEDIDYYTILAVSGIYGIDIQEDNVQESIERMKELLYNGSVTSFVVDNKEVVITNNVKVSEEAKPIINKILDKNIILGDMLDTSDNAARCIEYEFNPDRTVKITSCVLNDPTEMSNSEIGTYNYKDLVSALDDSNTSNEMDGFDF